MALQGSGTAQDPYLVGTPEELNQVRNDINASYKQIADIDMSTWGNFTPIGTSGSSYTIFRGNYDGNGYTISNINIYNESHLYNGLFSFIGGVSQYDRREVKNLKIINATVNGGTSVNASGVLAGVTNSHVDISNIEVVNATIHSRGEWGGGLAGYFQGGSSSNFINADKIVLKEINIQGTARQKGVMGGEVRHTRFNDCYSYSSPVSTTDNFSSIYVSSTRNYPTEFSYLNGIMMGDDGRPYLTFAGLNPDRAVGLSTEEDLNLIVSNPNLYFKLLNDIEVQTVHSARLHAFDVVFTGELDGDGYFINGLDMPSSSHSGKAIFKEIQGTIKNIGFNIKNIISGGGNVSLLSSRTSGKLLNINVVVSGYFQPRSGTGYNHGFAGYLDGCTIENCFIDSEFMSGYNNYQTFLTVMGVRTSGTPIVKNNIMIIRNSSPIRSGTQIIGGTGDFSDNVYHSSYGGFESQDGVTRVPSIDEIQNPNNTVYDNFDRNIWQFQEGKNPIQRIFIKIVDKIEERLVESYSHIIKGFNNRFVGRFERLASFSKSFKSKLLNKKIKLSNIVSFVESLQSNVSSRKSKFSNIKSFSKPIRSRVSRLKSSLRDSISHSKKYVSDVFNKKKSKKMTKTFTKKIYATSFADMISKTFRSAKSFSKKLKSNILHTKIANVIRKSSSRKFVSNLVRYRVTSAITKAFSKPFTSNTLKRIKKIFKINSFSNRFLSKSLSELAKRRMEQVKSYSRSMRSRIWRFTNVYQFVVIFAKSGVKAIVGNVERFSRIKRFAKNYTRKMTSWASMFYRVASPQEVYAFIKAKFNNIRLFKRENKTNMNKKKHKTFIRKSDDGGVD